MGKRIVSETDPTDEVPQVVSASDNASGGIEFDDRGQPRWRWITEGGTPAGSIDKTFDELRALTNDALALEDEAAPAEPEAAPTRTTGYNPYDVGGGEKTKTPKGR